MNRKRYSSDLTDAQWEQLSSFLPNLSTLRQTSQVGIVLNHQRYLLCR